MRTEDGGGEGLYAGHDSNSLDSGTVYTHVSSYT